MFEGFAGLDKEAIRTRLEALTVEELDRVRKLLEPPLPWKYIPHRPTPKQAATLRINSQELLYGGAAGGGKTDYLLMAALQYADHPDYSALLLRRTFAELSKADGLLERAQEWLAGTDAVWNGQDMRWSFPSGAVIEFGHIQYEKDKYHFQSAAYNFIGFDELTSFTEPMYTYLFSRLRRREGSTIPLRMRSASNPGGEGHEWVMNRFGLPEGRADRPFVPALLSENPHLDAVAYREALSKLDSITRKQLEQGDWTARRIGALFQRSWFEIVPRLPEPSELARLAVRRWDLAATEPHEGKDPDWTAGCRMHRSKDGKTFYVQGMERFRLRAGERDRRVVRVAKHDGMAVKIVLEQEPGAAGKAQIEYLASLLVGYVVNGQRVTGDKVTRAGPFASEAEHGNVKIVRGPWVDEFLNELEGFDGSGHSHDDQVDAASGAFHALLSRNKAVIERLRIG